jgi:NitT/TauT family transport system ATP-binding protein
VLQHAPLVVMIYHTLQEKANHAMPAAYSLDILDEHYPEAEARKQFETAVDWGRYAELFEFNAGEAKLYLPERTG